MRYEMFYDLRHVTDDLIFIKWYKSASEHTRPQTDFIDDLRKRLKESPVPLYFISDLRDGRIVDVSILQKLGILAQHPNYGGGAAFSEDVLSSMFVGIFSKFANSEKGTGVFYKTMPEALAYLESLKPGLVTSVDWLAFLETVDGNK
ncbi:MAG: hypothetical protein J0L63_05830 [Anaerolineae bacterium]|nr:hypothetical protein [Anaerolineae bacterium]MBN8618403.1 hypothetical protein [Anaerolineae bacterium]